MNIPDTMLIPVEDILPNFTAPVAEQVSTFRKDFFENFLLRGDEEMPALLCGRKNFSVPDGNQDCLFYSIIPFKEMVPSLIEKLLDDGAEWVMQVSEASVYEANPDGTKKDLGGEAVIFAAYAPGWQELAMHYIHRPVHGSMPEPIGDWQIYGESGESKLMGALVPFSDGQKSH
jgi:hypothetical protein